ncbi:hypothetical protein ACMXZI_04130 [Bacillus subtilis]|jgi:hypothetical protein|uniref:Uncharacterized protein n=4 Tax=Bacillus subtilis TaxID=1423 RepID=L8EAY3_BACSU|nr:MULTISPECIES: hypothetical protein [Bacillales]YP_009513992.1 hypothetical protein BSU_27786 [Bacillus subtilis subsp. subtilis str. 168]AOL30542.1 hypothetical protein BGM20_07810 [Alkalicoccobacillus gibsonii]MBW4824026.1 hypothetical protein [Bacillaceae bacterium]MDP4099771.1 hypothetical protein [Bacillota bacterium]MUG02671.1 hypothetical protein [Bacillus tequilensis]BAM53213.1 hypothetical protein BEST7613_4282 [Bacillus subtilis BEST7613]
MEKTYCHSGEKDPEAVYLTVRGYRIKLSPEQMKLISAVRK